MDEFDDITHRKSFFDDDIDDPDDWETDHSHRKTAFPLFGEEIGYVKSLLKEGKVKAWANSRGSIVFMALLLCMMNLLMLYADSLVFSDYTELLYVFSIKENVVRCLVGFVLMYLLACRFKKCSAKTTLWVGFILAALPILLMVPHVGSAAYYRTGLVPIGRYGGLAVSVRDTTILGYILIASWLIDQERDGRKLLTRLWLLGIILGAVMCISHNVAAAAVIFLCCLIFTAFWAEGMWTAIFALALSLVSAVVLIVHSVRIYDMNRDSFFDLKYQVQRVSAWALPSARQQSSLAVDLIWKKSGFFSNSVNVLKEQLPKMGYWGPSLNGLYFVSAFGKGLFILMILMEAVLLGLILNRFWFLARKGDKMRAVICLGIFLKLTAYTVFHFGYSFQILPFFSAYLPLVSGMGRYQMITLAELGLVLRG